ncbi:L-histidine N(alpha)-methyltransferase [Bradyrhizobium sp.]|uniref:L-histidine N(alpha)-methyltransferase n=1 Tax=Bradyrhizobium sp. TaxID=376 RepID=UPI003C6F8692
MALLQACALDIARQIPDDAVLIQFGSGASLKTPVVARRRATIGAHAPIDISWSAIQPAADRARCHDVAHSGSVQAPLVASGCRQWLRWTAMSERAAVRRRSGPVKLTVL